MRATVKDVASRAGVSPKTVSNVVNGLVPVSEKTRERVERALVELDYVPNLSARGLRTGRSGLIALALPNLQTAYSAEIVSAIVDIAHASGWSVQVEETGMEPVRERELLVKARAHQIDGLILNPVVLEDSAIERGTNLPPVVIIGEVEQELTDRVCVDSEGAAWEMTRFLLGLGHRSIVAVGAGARSVSAAGHLRALGYRRAMSEAGLETIEVEEGTWSHAGGAAVVEEYLSHNDLPDAFFCFTDGLAIGALGTLAERGLFAPDDVSVAGFDDIEAAKYLVPALTTVSFDKRAFAEATFAKLVNRMTNRSAEPGLTVVPHALVERASTRARP
ncbi:LacI family DNA-binding transcriptional regulator [Glaciibacter superstes]|uniref:LacI family DNA-binding transcriptional regulator n=1 Tax=Glaciibacter superstes TaxID=501023 RepID=UPI0003B4DFD0|nr:LacI family DNA-binding transcriptional regulator [Glaciibacter superstes]